MLFSFPIHCSESAGLLVIPTTLQCRMGGETFMQPSGLQEDDTNPTFRIKIKPSSGKKLIVNTFKATVIIPSVIMLIVRIGPGCHSTET